VVRNGNASVDDGISHSLVGIVEAHLGSKTPLLSLLGSLGHLGESSQTVLDGRLSSLGRDSVPSLLSHLQSQRSENRGQLQRGGEFGGEVNWIWNEPAPGEYHHSRRFPP